MASRPGRPARRSPGLEHYLPSTTGANSACGVHVPASCLQPRLVLRFSGTWEYRSVCGPSRHQPVWASLFSLGSLPTDFMNEAPSTVPGLWEDGGGWKVPQICVEMRHYLK